MPGIVQAQNLQVSVIVSICTQIPVFSMIRFSDFNTLRENAMNAQIVSFHCILKNMLGQIISSTFNRDVLTYDENQQEILAGLAKGLQNLTKGEKRKISLTPKEAYGFYDTRKVCEVLREELTPEGRLLVGSQVAFNGKGKKTEYYTVTKIAGDVISLDGNHPLAGQDLIFEIEAIDVRDATPEELWDSSSEFSKQRLH